MAGGDVSAVPAGAHDPSRDGATIGAMISPATYLQKPLPAPEERLPDVAAVLFDLDGTLIDTVELIRDSFRYATAQVLGEALPDAITMAKVGQPLMTQFLDMAPDHAEELLRVYRAYNMAHHDELAKAYPGTKETLEVLAAREVKMGVVTSKGTEGAMRGLDLFNLSHFFEVVVSADDVPIHKPDPYPLEFAAALMAVPLEYCVYLGDSPHDMQAAVDGDAISVAALWGAFTRDEVLAPHPAFALERIGQLPELLDGAIERYRVR